MFLSCCSPWSTKLTSSRPSEILLDPRRHADTARVRQSFQTSGHVHAVAENVAILDDDVADIDADAELDPAVRRHFRIALGHSALDVDGAAHGIDDAGELGQQPVARRLHQASAILGDLGIEQGRPVVPQLADRAFLVGAHQPAVAGYIGGQNGREPSLQAVVRQRISPQAGDQSASHVYDIDGAFQQGAGPAPLSRPANVGYTRRPKRS